MASSHACCMPCHAPSLQSVGLLFWLGSFWVSVMLVRVSVTFDCPVEGDALGPLSLAACCLVVGDGMTCVSESTETLACS